jgi:hypothetical protein
MQSKYLTAAELAAHLKVNPSWVREQTRGRVGDQIPHVRLGKYWRYVVGPELEQWIARRTRRANELPSI